MQIQLRSVMRHSLLVMALTAFASAAQAPVEVRVALVIGNAAYKNAPALVNPANDARDISAALRKLGFKVYDVIDGDRDRMAQSISELQESLKGKHAVAMLYYAGHGLQLDWRNYMVPVDANLNKAEDVPKQTVDVEQVIRAFRGAGTRMNIIVLDACRDNPFPNTSGSRGLAQLDAPPGTYLAFATAPGNVAEDGDEVSGNGLFTQFFLKELQRPASIESVFKRVRLQVRQKSQGRQVPWDSSSLEDEFAFNDGKRFTLTPEDYRREIQAAKDKKDRLKREAETALAREKQLTQQREQERLKLVEAQKIQEEQARLRAEADAKERDRRLAQAAEEELKKALAAQKAFESARLEEAQRVKDIELARTQTEEEERLRKLSAERQFEIQKAEWDRIRGSKDPNDFYTFLKKFPKGYITEQATFALESLEKAQIIEQPDKNGVIQRLGTARSRIGDYIEYRTLDDKGNQLATGVSLVTRIENGLVYINNASEPGRTLDGGQIRVPSTRGVVSYDPPRLDIPGGEFLVGKKWVWRAWMQPPVGSRFQLEGEVRVTGFEKVSVPAGTFQAFRVSQVQRTSDGSTYLLLDCWYDPEWAAPLKCVREFPRGSDKPRRETVEMTVRRRGTG